ncbi:MAG: cellulose binding domain-containing protein, partial [Clostridiales bacterium]|nr:cellulose binding domain-containing protein [Clostridiales bacterium]
MKCLSDRIKRSLCLTLSVLLILLSIPASDLYADDLSVKYYSVEEDVSYEVRHQIDSSWNSHANVTFFVKNTGNETINNWFLTFEYPYEIENIWGATLIERDNNTYTVRNSIFNQDIKAGQEVSFGMTVRSDGSEITEFPSWYLMNMKEYEVDNSKYLLTYQEYSKWNGGFNGALMLSSQETIEDWKMILRSGYEITNISNAILTVNEDGSYEISNDGYTQNLSYNTLVMNIQGIPSDNGISLTDVTMYSIGLAYGLTEDQDNNGTPDYRDLISSMGGTDIVTPTPTTEPTVTDTPTVTTEPVYEKNDLWVDRDGDGLSDDEEFMFGTDPDKYDTDG